MKAYIAERGYHHEGFTILGVFTTREAAESVIEADKKKVTGGDYWYVEEFELDGAPVDGN